MGNTTVSSLIRHGIICREILFKGKGWKRSVSEAISNEPERLILGCATRKSGTGEGTRTPTPLREADFESAASTNSATPAPWRGRTLIGAFAKVNKFVRVLLVVPTRGGF